MNYAEIEKILDKLINTGSEIPYLEELKNKSIDLLKKDRSLSEILYEIAKEINDLTEEFLEKKNKYGTNFVTGISTGIYLPDYNDNGKYKFKVWGGTTSRDNNSLINENTLFDLASITKLYTLVLLFKLEELGLVDLNTKVSDLNSDIQGLQDFTLNDLIRFHGELYTKGNIREASSPMEAYERLKTVYLKSDRRDKNTYTDFGAMVIADTIEKIVSKALGKEMSYDEIMNKFLFEPLNLKDTTFHPDKSNVAGNANDLGLPHDPKARIIGRPTGSAGLFTNSNELMDFSQGILGDNYLNQQHKKQLSQITFPGNSHGHLGTFVKNPNGGTYAPKELSNDSFAAQGWTGQVAMFDNQNKIHSHILVNAIQKTDNKEIITNDKPYGFLPEFKLYQSEIVKRILLMYIAKKYYNNYCEVYDNIEQNFNLKR